MQNWRFCLLKRVTFNQPPDCLKAGQVSDFPRLPAKGELVQFDGRWYEVSQVMFQLDSNEVQIVVVDKG